MDEKKMKQWLCNENHILGYIHWNGNGLPQLMVLREALDMNADDPREVDNLGLVTGQASVHCSICDGIKLWDVSVDVLLALFSRLSDKQVFEFSQRLLEMSAKVVDVDDPASTPSVGVPTSPPNSKYEFGGDK
jgi:hypothetical protein